MASAESSSPHLPTESPLSDVPLVPTTDAIPRFRILIVGRSGVGKSSLINAIFKASLANVKHDGAGEADINDEITSKDNNRFVLHDSQGYEPGDDDKFNILKKFITDRSRRRDIAERIHAIWLCIQVPYSNARIEKGDERIFDLKPDKVPIIVVFTKYDLLVGAAELELRPKKSDKEDEDTFQQRCLKKAHNDFRTHCDRKFTKNVAEQINCIFVAQRMPETLQNLVQVTSEHIGSPAGGPSTTSPLTKFKGLLFNRASRSIEPPRLDEVQSGSTPGSELSDASQTDVALASAQRVDMPTKIKASIRIGKKKYWRAIASGIGFSNQRMITCANAIHTDIIKIWNIRGLDEFFLGDSFRGQMTVVVADLSDKDGDVHAVRDAFSLASAGAGLTAAVAAGAIAGPVAPIVAPVAAAIFLAVWAYKAYRKSPENVRCLMGYVVDLTLIMQAVFRASLERQDGIVEQQRVEQIADKFDKSEKKNSIHTEVKSFVSHQNPFAKDAVLHKIEALIEQNRDFSL